jgi:DNA-binding response OmpR family regulator
MSRILIVDDDIELRENIADILQDVGFETVEAPNGQAALNLIDGEDFSLVLLDMVMPGMNGVDALTEIKRRKPQTRVIMITAFATVQSAVNAIQKGASDYITKPFKIEELVATTGRVLEEARFEEGAAKIGFDNAMSALNNPLRRNIIRMLHERKSMRLMEITRELKIEDHTKIVFHLRNLKDADVIDQDYHKAYFLTEEGARLYDCMKILENYVSENESS